MRVLLIILVVFLVACSPARQPFHRIVILPETKVHVFSAPTPMGWAKRGEIMVSGKIVNGAIVADDNVLAHEMKHLLQIENPEFVNPDKVR